MSGCIAFPDSASRAVPGETGARTLLIVDDEENVLRSLKRLLRRDGYAILTAPGGLAALDTMRRSPVDVVISDMLMPGMDGIEFLSAARGAHPAAVRIMLSAHLSVDVLMESINEAGVFKFFAKPWDDDALRQAVREAFDLAGSRRGGALPRRRRHGSSRP